MNPPGIYTAKVWTSYADLLCYLLRDNMNVSIMINSDALGWLLISHPPSDEAINEPVPAIAQQRQRLLLLIKLLLPPN